MNSALLYHLVYFATCITVSLSLNHLICIATCILPYLYHLISLPLTVRCNFDGGLCGFTNDKFSDFVWTSTSGPSPTSHTGPVFDHTTLSQKGTSLFIIHVLFYHLLPPLVFIFLLVVVYVAVVAVIIIIFSQLYLFFPI